MGILKSRYFILFAVRFESAMLWMSERHWLIAAGAISFLFYFDKIKEDDVPKNDDDEEERGREHITSFPLRNTPINRDTIITFMQAVFAAWEKKQVLFC